MSSFVIEGGHRLSGEIQPQGAKNEALEVISAVPLTESRKTGTKKRVRVSPRRITAPVPKKAMRVAVMVKRRDTSL